MSTRTRQQAISFVRNQLGQDYVWGGSSRAQGGFDCSGLIYAAYRQAGYTGIGRTTYEQIKNGVRVDPAHLQPGDLVFSSPHHVGMYVGNGQVISSPHTGAVVHRIPLQDFGGVYEARRVTGGGGGVQAPPHVTGHPAVLAQLMLGAKTGTAAPAPGAALASITPQTARPTGVPSLPSLQAVPAAYRAGQPLIPSNPAAQLDQLAKSLRAGVA